MTPEAIPWIHILIEAGVIVIPVLCGFYLTVRKITWTLREYRPHRHQEKRGELFASGIVYSRSMNGED